MKTIITLLIGALLATIVITVKNKKQAISLIKTKQESNTVDEFSGTKGHFTDNRDGKSYRWIKIGNQIWMAQNLAYNTHKDGCCYYDDERVLAGYFGYLYDWNIAMNVAPKGWHLPSDSEWEQMISYLKENSYSYNEIKGDDAIAKSLCINKFWGESDVKGSVGNNDYTDVINKTGFSALAAGCKDNFDGYLGIGVYAKWWTATDGDKIGAYCRTIYFENKTIDRGEFYTNDKTMAYSVRCIKD